MEQNIKSSIVIDNYFYKNRLFNLNDNISNRDNCLYPYISLKEMFSQKNIDLSTYDINIIEDSKIVIYNDMPEVLPNKEDIEKSYLLIFESELIKPENWDLNNHKYFNKIFTWDDKIIDNKKYFKINFSHLIPKKINKDLSKKENLCTLIAGNKQVNHPLELYSKRVEAIQWFEKYHLEDFDFYGMGWDDYTSKNRYIRFLLKKFRLSKLVKSKFQSYKGKIDSKKEVLEKYKFAICYENAKDISGYITEKIFDCFFAGCIPIYWGTDNVTEHIPKECFIDKREFNTYEELYDYMINMSDEVYLKFLDSIEMYLNSKQVYEFSAEYFANTIVKTILNDIN